MGHFKNWLQTAALVGSVLAFMAGYAVAQEKPGGDVVDTAAAAGNFNTLVAAIKQAGLTETLKAQGPYTIFAPTDEAFARVPRERLDALLKNKEQLKAVLNYHVLSGRTNAMEVLKQKSLRTVQGGELKVEVSMGTVLIDGARVLKTDIPASNGIIHSIDAVLLPQ